MSRSPLTLLNSNGARSEAGSHSTRISGPPDTRHKLNHQIKPPSFLPSSSPPWHSSSPFKAAVLSPGRTCRGLSWLQKEAPGTQAPQERQPSWARGGQKRGSKLSAQHSGGRGGRDGGWRGPGRHFWIPPPSPAASFTGSFLPALSQAQDRRHFPPFSAPTIHSFLPACIPQRQLLSLGNRTAGSRERAWEPLRASLCTPQLSLRCAVGTPFPPDTTHRVSQPGPERGGNWGHYLGVKTEPFFLFRIKFEGRKKKKPHEIISAALTKTRGAHSGN